MGLLRLMSSRTRIGEAGTAERWPSRTETGRRPDVSSGIGPLRVPVALLRSRGPPNAEVASSAGSVRRPAFTCAWPDRHRPNSMCRTSLGRSIATAACLGLARFDGHPPSGVLPRRGCPSWRPWNVRSLARAGRSRPSPRPRSSSPCQRGDRSIGQVARDFDLTETAVREWVRQAERDAGTRGDGGLTSAERQELSALRRENRRLRQDVEILKRATAFFVKETR
jgi:transposase